MEPDRELLALYERYRAEIRSLHAAILEGMPKKAVIASAKRLGMYHKGVIAFDNESEADVLQDYVIHSFRGLGPTMLERYAAREKPPEGSDTAAVLEAMARGFYALTTIEDIVPGYGLVVTDVVRQRELPLIDINLSHGAHVGVAFIGRLFPFARFHTTAGAFLPVRRTTLERIQQSLVTRFGAQRAGKLDNMTPKEESDFAAICIRIALADGASHYVRYAT